MENTFKLQWSENLPCGGVVPGTSEKIPYDFCYVNTPLGLITIEWKSWKSQTGYDIQSDKLGWIGCEYNLDDAKEFTEKWMKNIHTEIGKMV